MLKIFIHKIGNINGQRNGKTFERYFYSYKVILNFK